MKFLSWWRETLARRRYAATPVARHDKNPIIRPEMLPNNNGSNINGPSLIATPEWLPGRMGKYYLYFAHHRGSYIRLAYADNLNGPWTIHQPGTLKLADALMCREHIASPDIHIDEAARRIRMYFHGPEASGREQKSFLALSTDGIDFVATNEVLAGPYLRCLPWNREWFGMDMDGYVYRSTDGLRNFERRPEKMEFSLLHGMSLRDVALHKVSSTLRVYYTLRGDRPERIWRSVVDTTGHWSSWCPRGRQLILAPQAEWEGAGLRMTNSRPGPSRRPEHALRDPAIFVEHGTTYLLYAVAGESGIAIGTVLPD
jgi:hypothetical protein